MHSRRSFIHAITETRSYSSYTYIAGVVKFRVFYVMRLSYERILYPLDPASRVNAFTYLILARPFVTLKSPLIPHHSERRKKILRRIFLLLAPMLRSLALAGRALAKG